LTFGQVVVRDWGERAKAMVRGIQVEFRFTKLRHWSIEERKKNAEKTRCGKHALENC